MDTPAGHLFGPASMPPLTSAHLIDAGAAGEFW
jgi:hypothetical protein